ASARVDTRGMDRNIIAALIAPSVPRAGVEPCGPFLPEGLPVEDLSRYSGAARGLNVVMVSLESTAAQYLSLFGGGHQVMPNLTALAGRALVFDNAYAVYPESIKGLYSVLCSA